MSFDDSKYASVDSPDLALTRLAGTHPAAAPGPSDSEWFDPHQSQHYRRPRGPPTSTLNQPAAQWAEENIDTIPPSTGTVDGSIPPRAALSAAKASFITSWQRQQEAALGIPPGSAHREITLQQQLMAAMPEPPQAKVEFRPMPMEQSTGPAFNFFPNDSPPAAGAISQVVTAADVLSQSVEFIPLSSGASTAGSGIWSRMSSWSKIQFNREGMRLEDGRNARGTAEQVLYTIWQNAQQGKLPSSANTRLPPSAPVFQHKLADGKVLLSSNPPSDSSAPPPPLPRNFLRHRTDKARERHAMAMQDWNVLSLHDPTILNPYDPIESKKKHELQQARLHGGAIARTGLWAGMTKAEKQSRLNIERERMVYEDCNVAGAPRGKSSYRFIPKVNNRKMYSTSWGPVSFGAGAPFGSLPFLPYPLGSPSSIGWLHHAGSPEAAWKLHQSNLSRERRSMANNDVDAKTGTRLAPFETEFQAQKRMRTKQEQEKAALSKNDRNVISTGSGPRGGIYTAQLGTISYASNRGKTYIPAPPPKPTRRAHLWAASGNLHPASRKSAVARSSKRKLDAMRGLSVGGEGDRDQSTNVQDQHALDGVDIPDGATFTDAKQLSLLQQGAALVAQANYAATVLSHGQAYSQRSRLRYRYIDVPGYNGPPVLVPGVIPPPATVAIKQVRVGRDGRPIRRHRLPGRPNSSEEEARRAVNINTPYTLIPRWSEADCPFDPARGAAAAAAGAPSGASVSVAPFFFDDSAGYVFDRVDRRGPGADLSALHPSIRPVFGSIDADIAAWPFRQKAKRFFAQTRMQKRIARGMAQREKIDSAHKEASEPAHAKWKWRYLSSAHDQVQADFESMIAAQRQLQPWHPTLGSASGAVGFYLPPSHTLATPKSTAKQKPAADVFFNQVGAASTFGAFGMAPSFSSSTPTAAPNNSVCFHSTRGAPSATLAQIRSNNPLDSHPSSVAVDPVAALKRAFDDALNMNPFRHPTQLAGVEAFVAAESERAAAEAKEAKLLKATRKFERDQAKEKKRSNPFAPAAAAKLDFESPAPIDFDRIVASGPFKPTTQNTHPSQIQSNRALASTSTATSTATSSQVDFNHPVFGKASSPYSPLESFDKWRAFNDQHSAAMIAAASQPTGKYHFKPCVLPSNRPDTSSEDDSNDDDDDPFAAHARESERAHAKRKSHPASVGAGVTFGRPEFASTVTPASTRAVASSTRSRSHSRSRDAAILRSSLKSPKTIFSSADSRTRTRSRSRGRSAQSVSPDPFEWHANRRERERIERIEAAFPPNRSSVLFTRPNDRANTLGAVDMNQLTLSTREFGRTARLESPHRFDHSPSSMSSPFNARVTPSAFASLSSPSFDRVDRRDSTSFSSSSTSTIPPPASLGQFHTGFDAHNPTQKGFVPFIADWSDAHTDRGSYAAPNPISQSPTKRLKAMRRERGTKRGEWDQQRLDDADEAEWQAQAEREQFRRDQLEMAQQQWALQQYQPPIAALSGSMAATHSHAAPQYQYQPQPQSHSIPFGYSYSSPGGPSSSVGPSSHYGGVHVNFHSPPAPHTHTHTRDTGVEAQDRYAYESDDARVRPPPRSRPAANRTRPAEREEEEEEEETQPPKQTKSYSRSSKPSSNAQTPLEQSRALTPTQSTPAQPHSPSHTNSTPPDPTSVPASVSPADPDPPAQSPSPPAPASSVPPSTLSSASSKSSLSVFGFLDDLATERLTQPKRPKPVLSSSNSEAKLE